MKGKPLIKQWHMVSRTKVCLGVAVILLFTMQASALWYLNDWEIIYGDYGTYESTNSTSLRGYVVEGGGHFLKSYSDYLLFLNKLEVAELNDLDYTELQAILNNAIENMEHARAQHLELRKNAAWMPYSEWAIDALNHFNYDEYQKKYDLIKPVFNQVKSYLENGLLLELQNQSITQIDKILVLAYQVKVQVDAGQFPDLITTYNLSEAYSQSLSFGQYAARVFQEIKKP